MMTKTNSASNNGDSQILQFLAVIINMDSLWNHSAKIQQLHFTCAMLCKWDCVHVRH